MNQPSNGQLAPPYLPFATFLSGIEGLRAHGLPTVVDRSAWGSRSGADQSSLMSTLRFLRLIDEKGQPQEFLKQLVAVEGGSSGEKTILDEVLRKEYAPVFALDLKTATPNQLSDAIGSFGNFSTKSRAIRFFLKAAEYTGVELSKRLSQKMRERAPRASNGDAPDTTARPRRRTRTRRSGSAGGEIDASAATAPPPVGGAMKTINLVVAGGSLTLNGTFNPFQLNGKERELVYAIIDKMNEYELEAGAGNT